VMTRPTTADLYPARRSGFIVSLDLLNPSNTSHAPEFRLECEIFLGSPSTLRKLLLLTHKIVYPCAGPLSLFPGAAGSNESRIKGSTTKRGRNSDYLRYNVEYNKKAMLQLGGWDIEMTGRQESHQRRVRE